MEEKYYLVSYSDEENRIIITECESAKEVGENWDWNIDKYYSIILKGSIRVMNPRAKFSLEEIEIEEWNEKEDD